MEQRPRTEVRGPAQSHTATRKLSQVSSLRSRSEVTCPQAPREKSPLGGNHTGMHGRPYLQGQGACGHLLALGTIFRQVVGLWSLGVFWLSGHWLGLGRGGLLPLLAFLYFNNQVTARVISWERRLEFHLESTQ